jgi:putative transposase
LNSEEKGEVGSHQDRARARPLRLDRLTARLSYCVWLFSRLIEEHDMDVDGYGEFTREDMARIAKLTRLSSGYMQQCRDQALWMWRSYRAQHQDWERRLRRVKARWCEKLLRREPKKPFHNGVMRKIPVRIDSRTGIVEASKRIKLSLYVIKLSTLKRRMRVTIPMNPARHHLNLLMKGRVVDFQLVKRDGKYEAHICVKYEAPDRPIRGVRGIDLGVRRAMATVLLKPNQQIRRGDLSILRDSLKKHRLDMLNRRVVELQQARKWEPLKRLRHKRRHVAEYYDRLDAIRIAEMAENEASTVAAGYPKDIKYMNYRGNGKRRLRRMLQQRFPYSRRIRYMIEECVERGIKAEAILEPWTSRTCHRCGSINTRRIGQSLIWCHNCGLQYNADWNSAINIGSVFLPEALNRMGGDDTPKAWNEVAEETSEPRSPRPLGGGVSHMS